MCLKNNSPNLTQKVLVVYLLKDWWSICLSYLFSGCSSMEGHKRLSRLFSDNLLAMLDILAHLNFFVFFANFGDFCYLFGLKTEGNFCT